MSFREELEKYRKGEEKEKKEEEEEPESIEEGQRTVSKDVDEEELEVERLRKKRELEVEELKLVEYRYFRERLEGKRGSLGKEETLQRLKRLVEKHLEIVKKKKKN